MFLIFVSAQFRRRLTLAISSQKGARYSKGVQNFRAEFGFTLVPVIHVLLLQHELAIEDVMQHYH
jgi:hypothetical protein